MSNYTTIPTITTRFYYTFKEVLEAFEEADDRIEVYLDYVGDADDVEHGLSDIVEECTTDSKFNPLTIEDTYTKTMFTQYLWPQFQDSVILYIDVEHYPWIDPDEPTYEDFEEWFNAHGMLWMRWLRDTKQRYELLISQLTSIQDDLLARLGSTNTTLFNDTPQNGGDFTSDEYTTNATQTTTEADVGTPMARLKEVQDNLRNYYADWADGFRQFVILTPQED